MMLIKVFTRSLSPRLPTSIGPIYVMAMSPDGQFIVSGSQERTVKIFDLQKKQLVHFFKFAHEGFD